MSSAPSWTAQSSGVWPFSRFAFTTAPLAISRPGDQVPPDNLDSTQLGSFPNRK